jgi:hypothetical protein
MMIKGKDVVSWPFLMIKEAEKLIRALADSIIVYPGFDFEQAPDGIK